MAAELIVESLTARGFRNLTNVSLKPARRVNVISGANGQGKTSLLEALYFLATSKSFRTERSAELKQDGTSDALVTGGLSEDQIPRRQKASLTARNRGFFIADQRIRRLSEYATQTPIVIFHPGDLLLTQGPASHRRTLLDRVALFVDPPSADHRLKYQLAQRERAKILEQRGTNAVELDAFETVMAEHGARFAKGRRTASDKLLPALREAFLRLAHEDLTLELEYQPGGPDTAPELAKALALGRLVDRMRKRTSVGPHRDEVSFTIDGRSARQHASQGQHRILTLAIKMAELSCIREARGAHPLLLLDDVSSELDPERTGSVYAFLRDVPSQVFVTTTRPELFQTPLSGPSERADFVLQGGQLSPL